MHPVRPQGTTLSSPSVTAAIVIPARFQSTRLPGKPLAEIAGRPMIEHVYLRARASTRASSVIVATDDQRIYDAVGAFGGEARLTRPDHATGMDRLAEVARSLDAELIVNVQGDEPLLDPMAIDLALESAGSDPTVGIVTLRCRFTRSEDLASPHVVKVVVDCRGFALYFSRAPIPYGASLGPDSPGSTYRHIGLYVYRRNQLLELARLAPSPLEQAERLEQLRALEYGHAIKTVETTHEPIGVDTPEDLERVRRIMSPGAFS